MMNCKDLVFEQLANGCKDMPIKSTELKSLTGSANVRRNIRELRKDGVMVMANYYGYWITNDFNEYVKYINDKYTKRAIKMLELRKEALSSAYDRLYYDKELEVLLGELNE